MTSFVVQFDLHGGAPMAKVQRDIMQIDPTRLLDVVAASSKIN